MKKYICFIFLLGLFACQEDDLVSYSEEKDGLQFHTDEAEGIATDMIFDFTMATYENNEGKLCYYGDSLKQYMFEEIIVDLQGFPTPDERPYKLKTVLVDRQDSTKVAEVLFESYYSLAPNELRDTISFTVLRPEARGNYVVGVVIDTDDEDAFFTTGVEEQSILRVELRNIYEEPVDWQYREDYFGSFDQEKYAFMVTYSQDLFSRDNNHMWNETDLYNQELRLALEQFNASAAPEDRKTFSFPLTTKPVWWDERGDLLGEFSEEKHDFIKQILEKEGKDEPNLKNNNKLYYWNLIFRQRVEEEGIVGIEFPRYEQKAIWWNETALGSEWSVEKQEFVILNLFPMTGYLPNEDTWDFAASVLRMSQDRWNLSHPKDELKYEFGNTEQPKWWNFYIDQFGSFSLVKQDVIVETILKQSIYENGRYDIKNLVDGNTYWVSSMNSYIIEAINEYNQNHPDSQISDYPGMGNTAPSWWKDEYLGVHSQEKENFVKSVVEQYNGYLNYVTDEQLANWALICRYELAVYNAEHQDKPLAIEFPAVSKLKYWDELPYLGEWTESKQAFIMMRWQLVQYYFPDGWALGAPSAGGEEWSRKSAHEFLVEQYELCYDDFMKKYEAAKPEAFTFPVLGE